MLTFETAQYSTQIPRVQPKFLANVGRSRSLAMGEFVQHASFGKSEGTACHPIQHTDLARIEAVEFADRAYLLVKIRPCHPDLPLAVDNSTDLVDRVNYTTARVARRASRAGRCSGLWCPEATTKPGTAGTESREVLTTNVTLRASDVGGETPSQHRGRVLRSRGRSVAQRHRVID